MEETSHEFLSTGRNTGKSLLAEALKRYEEELRTSEQKADPKTEGGNDNG